MKVKEEPVSYFINFFVPALLDPKFFERFTRQRFLRVIIDAAKMEINKVEQTVQATVADIDLAKVLSIDFGDPLFYVENIYYAKGDAVALTHMYHRGDVYLYKGITDFNKDIVK